MKKLNIAIVDDCPADLFVLSKELNETGDFNLVMMAMNGSDFIKKFEKEKPELDLLLLDLHMPVLNGIDTIKILKTMKINFKILVISHGFYTVASQELHENGIIHYCRKNTASILATIPSVMQGTNVYKDRELTRNWEELSLNTSLKSKDEGYWRDTLGPVDLKIIKLIANGLNAKEISKLLGYEASSIEKYRTNMLRALEVKNIAHLTAWGFTHGVLIGSDIFIGTLGKKEF